MNAHRLLASTTTPVAMGVLSVLIMLFAYGIQLWKTYRKKSEPHPITWFGFGFLTAIGYLVQCQKGAGAGSWVMGLTAVFCLLVAGMSQYVHRRPLKYWPSEDWIVLLASIFLFIFYLASRQVVWGALVSAILATAADLVLYIPTFRKAWKLPHKEVAMSYLLNSLKFIPSLFAMRNYSIETCLYPSALVVANGLVVVFLLWRRKSILNAP